MAYQLNRKDLSVSSLRWVWERHACLAQMLFQGPPEMSPFLANKDVFREYVDPNNGTSKQTHNSPSPNPAPNQEVHTVDEFEELHVTLLIHSVSESDNNITWDVMDMDTSSTVSTFPFEAYQQSPLMMTRQKLKTYKPKKLNLKEWRRQKLNTRTNVIC